MSQSINVQAVKKFPLKVDIGLLAISDRLYDPVCAGLTDDQLAFLWAIIVLLYWQIYSYIHMRQNLFRDCYGIITKNYPCSSTIFRCITDVLTINNNIFHNYAHLICPNELEIKDTT
jgi:hypothetical protein